MRQVARGEALCQLAQSEGDEPLEDAEQDEVQPCMALSFKPTPGMILQLVSSSSAYGCVCHAHATVCRHWQAVVLEGCTTWLWRNSYLTSY